MPRQRRPCACPSAGNRWADMHLVPQWRHLLHEHARRLGRPLPCGRRPQGHRELRARHGTAARLAQAAQLEAASVLAFGIRMPSSSRIAHHVRCSALRCGRRRDEARHARMTMRLAQRRGERPATPLHFAIFESRWGAPPPKPPRGFASNRSAALRDSRSRPGSDRRRERDRGLRSRDVRCRSRPLASGARGRSRRARGHAQHRARRDTARGLGVAGRGLGEREARCSQSRRDSRGGTARRSRALGQRRAPRERRARPARGAHGANDPPAAFDGALGTGIPTLRPS